MRLTITEVDGAPEDLSAQTPFDVDLIRKVPGADRPDYWLGRLRRPLRWKHEGADRLVTHVVVAAKLAGMEIGREPTLPVGIAYVTDPAAIHDARLDFARCAYVAVGMARERGAVFRSRRVLAAVLLSLVVLLVIRALTR
jgi:hypothetical protein